MILALFALAILMIVGGGASVIQGFPFVRLESGLAMVIAGATTASAGAVVLSVATLAARVRALAQTLAEAQDRGLQDAAFADPMSDFLSAPSPEPDNRPAGYAPPTAGPRADAVALPRIDGGAPRSRASHVGAAALGGLGAGGAAARSHVEPSFDDEPPAAHMAPGAEPFLPGLPPPLDRPMAEPEGGAHRDPVVEAPHPDGAVTAHAQSDADRLAELREGEADLSLPPAAGDGGAEPVGLRPALESEPEPAARLVEASRPVEAPIHSAPLQDPALQDPAVQDSAVQDSAVQDSAVQESTLQESTLQEPEPDPATLREPQPQVVGTYASGGNTYVMYATGVIEADTPRGRFTFGSLDELKAFVEAGGEADARGAA